MSRRFRPLPNGSAMAPGTTGVLSRVLSGRPKERAIKLTAALLLAALGTYSLLRSSLPPPTASRVYGLMIDAGSTGSRVHTFAFDRVADPAAAAASAAAATSAAAAKAAAAKAAKLQLHDEDFLAIKPGLSSFKTDPKAAADSLLPLLARAQEVIPASQWEQTPVFLRATAGLRMVGEEAADRILREVRQTLAASEFRFDEDKGTEWVREQGGWVVVMSFQHGSGRGGWVFGGRRSSGRSLQRGSSAVAVASRPGLWVSFSDDFSLLGARAFSCLWTAVLSVFFLLW